ncbi:MAG: Gldg family protein, partial [Bacteroidales bacterium]|nr:Gldg family protein [Bacteroidales bacterium]
MKIKQLSTKGNRSAQKSGIRRNNFIYIGATLLIILFANLIGRYVYTRLDLTSEKRYTLADSTKKLLRGIDETVMFRVYLEGDFPGDFKRLQNETKDMLNQFRSYNDYIEYEFVDPNSFADDKERQQTFYNQLASKGIRPTVIERKGEGSQTQQIIIPYVEVAYKGREAVVNLLPSQKWVSQEEELNNAVQSLEYNLTDAIRRLSRIMPARIGFLQGHGELERQDIFDIQMTLVEYYT